MKGKLFIVFLLWLSILFLPGNGITSKSGEKPVPDDQWNENTKLWLARSCVGETQFGIGAKDESMEECFAIAWVYAKRYKELQEQGKGKSLFWIITRYSSALKGGSTKARPWILYLGYDLEKPKHWPDHLSWDVHRPLWKDKLDRLDQWFAGNAPDPVPQANHYGGAMDAHRAEYVWGWKRLSAPPYFQNRFYTSRVKSRPTFFFPHPVNL